MAFLNRNKCNNNNTIILHYNDNIYDKITSRKIANKIQRTDVGVDYQIYPIPAKNLQQI